MGLKRHIPNLLTAGNLFCGVLGIVAMNESSDADFKVLAVMMLMFIAMILDFLDGFVARLLKVQGPFGAQLDSLADVVTFGVLPGILVVEMLGQKAEKFDFAGDINLPFVGLLLPVFAALRLAKFNIDTRQTTGFLGVPTPTMAMFFLSLFVIDSGAFDGYFTKCGGLTGFDINRPFCILVHPYSIAFLTLLFCALMVIEIPLLGMKFKSFGFRENMMRYLLVASALFLIFLIQIKAIPVIILLYFLFSFIHFRFLVKQDA